MNYKRPTSSSYKDYEREIYMSEYVTIPKARLRRLIITEVIAWGVAGLALIASIFH